MAIAYVAKSEASYSSRAGEISLSRPAGSVAGNALVALVEVESEGAFSSPSIAQVQSLYQGGGSYKWRMGVFVGVDDGSSPFTVKWTGTKNSQGVLLSYSGTHATTPYDTSSGKVGGAASTALAIDAITTSFADSMLVALGQDEASTTATPASGMTERHDANATHVADVIQAVAGSTGAKNMTLAASARSLGALVALRPAVAASSLAMVI